MTHISPEDYNLINANNSIEKNIQHHIDYWERLLKENPKLDPTIPRKEIKKLREEL